MEFQHPSDWERHGKPMIFGLVRLALLLALIAFGIEVVYQDLLQIRSRGCTVCYQRDSL